jgi:ubiquitin C-terminal hydrolase
MSFGRHFHLIENRACTNTAVSSLLFYFSTQRCEQRDAHEFLSDLVNFLHDELTASKSTPPLPPREEKEVDDAGVSSIHDRFSPNENRHPNKVDGKVGAGKSSTIKHGFASTTTTMKGNHGDLPTDEYFQLNVRVCLKCDSCGYPRSKDEMYRHLSVDLGEDSEQDIWTVEKGLKQFFQPEKRDVKCEKCQVGTTATQTLEVLSR